jgi:hypothetical protein
VRAAGSRFAGAPGVPWAESMRVVLGLVEASAR